MPLDILHRKIKGIFGLIDAIQRDKVGVFDSSHQLYLIFNGIFAIVFEGWFLHECLDCYSAIGPHIFS